jgi:hypothetical protein
LGVTVESAFVLDAGVQVGGKTGASTVGLTGVKDGRIKTGTGVSGGKGLRAELGKVKIAPTIPATRQIPKMSNIEKTFQMDDDFIDSPYKNELGAKQII